MDKKNTSLMDAVELYFKREFNQALEILDKEQLSDNEIAEMWKLIILSEKEGEDVLDQTRDLHGLVQGANNPLLKVGYFCAQTLGYLKNRNFTKIREMVEQVNENVSHIKTEETFEAKRLVYLSQIIAGSAYLSLGDFKKSGEYYEEVYFSKLSDCYLWHKLRAAYTILFGGRENEVTPKLLKIAEEAVNIAKELEIGDQIRIHYRNLVRLQVQSGKIEEAKETYEQMFSSYRRSSETPLIIENFILNLDRSTKILEESKNKFSKQSIVIDLPAGSYLFVGDIHGDLEALIRAFTLWKDNYEHIVFIGDIVDYGGYQLECLTLMSKMMLEYPDKVHMLRGNHETRTICSFYGFQIETYVRHNKEIFEIALKMFKEMPIAAVVDNRVFCVHGGVGGNEEGEIVQLPEIRNFKKSDELDIDLYQVLWNDPSEDFDDSTKYFDRGFRGRRTRIFGKRAVDEFCKKSDIETIIRAHSRYDEGYRNLFDGKLWSLFSSKYWDPKISPSVLGWDHNNFKIYNLWKDVKFNNSTAKELLEELI